MKGEDLPFPVSMETKQGNKDSEKDDSISISTGIVEIDFFSQAVKTLSERSPFDAVVTEENSNLTLPPPTLPSECASLLNRNSDGRRRRKKSHSGVEKKKSSRQFDKARGRNVWVETEDYFRELKLQDIDVLSQASSPFSVAARKCYSIPPVGISPRSNVASFEDDKVAVGKIDSEDVKKEECVVGNDSVTAGDDKCDDSIDSCSSLEWLLGCRNKVSLASERPSKRRRLLDGEAGLEKFLMGSTGNGESSVCHYCCRGDISRESSKLVVCVSCKVAVHKKCYGVVDDVEESWLCSWCKQKDGIDEKVNPCVLCPKKGGALKPVHRREGSAGSMQFAHLFCCLWTPEVYIEDVKKMEPVMNVKGVPETRKKLVCSICKVKVGACIRCSHGMFCCPLVLLPEFYFAGWYSGEHYSVWELLIIVHLLNL